MIDGATNSDPVASNVAKPSTIVLFSISFGRYEKPAGALKVLNSPARRNLPQILVNYNSPKDFFLNASRIIGL